MAKSGPGTHDGILQPEETALSLEDLAILVSKGHIADDLQRCLARVIRRDPRFAESLAKLETLASDAGIADLWLGLERNQEFDRLLEAESWVDSAETLNPTTVLPASQ